MCWVQVVACPGSPGTFPPGSPGFSWNFWLKPRFSNSRDLGGHFLLYESSWNLFPTDFVTKTCKKSPQIKVSNSSRQFPRVYRGFPTLSNPPRGSSMMSEGSQPVAPTLHACQEKIDHRVSAKNWSQSVGTKLMTGNWWLMIDHWSWMIDDW